MLMGLRWAAFLRGVNVGGHNRLPMADVRDALTSAGFSNVRTYIQSGNIVFDSDGGAADDPESLASTISDVIAVASGVDVPVMVLGIDELRRIIDAHPDRGGEVPDKWLLAFLFDGPIDAAAAPDSARFAPDRLVIGEREALATFPTGSGRSKLTIDMVERAFGVRATARNLTTIERVIALASHDT